MTLKNFPIAQYSFSPKRLAVCLYLVVLSALSLPAQAQIQEHWDMNARERSQYATSLGITHLNRGQTAKAVALFRDAVRHDPTDAVAFGSLGVGLAVEGKYAEALDALQNSYRLDKIPETLVSTGIVYYLDHDYDAAINAWSKALEKDPKLHQLQGNIGFAYLRKGDLQQAELQFQKLVKSLPNSSFGYHGLALTRYLAGNFASARRAAEQAESIESYPHVSLLLAKLDFIQGDAKSGMRRVSAYNSAIKNKKRLNRSMTQIGYPKQHDVHWDPFLADNFDSGNMLLARVLADPTKPSKQRSLANKAKAAQAIATINQALSGMPSSPVSKKVLFGEASTTISGAVSELPNDFYLVRELAMAKLAAGHYEDATEAFRKVLDLCPNCNVDFLHLGRSLAMSGKGSDGAQAVAEFQKRFPNQQISPIFSSISGVQGGPDQFEPIVPKTSKQKQASKRRSKKVKEETPKQKLQPASDF
jgi:tetratricopeptide (TPR) repeat protein